MPGQQARVRLVGTSPEDLDEICGDVREIADKTGVALSGPEGTATWEHWEMRVHKRLIDIDADERALRQLMRIQVPNDVNIEIVLED